MKKFQNSRKFLASPSYNDPVIVGEGEKKQGEIKGGKTPGGLRIFFESKNLNSEPRLEWNFRSGRKKLQKYATRKLLVEEKKKKCTDKKNETKALNSYEFLQNHFVKMKSEAPAKLHPTRETRNIDEARLSEEKNKINEPENLKAPVNSLFTIRKETLNPGKKFDAVKAMHESTPIQKPAEKMELPETNNQDLDFGKKKINDILKMHAQKFQTCSTKSNQHLRDSFQGVTELLKRVQNIPNTYKEKKSEKESTETDTKKEKRPEVGEIKLKVAIKESAVKEIPPKEETSEEKKKLPVTLLKLPQSNELERRLQAMGGKAESLFPSDKDSSMRETEAELDSIKENVSEEKNQKKENFSEEKNVKTENFSEDKTQKKENVLQDKIQKKENVLEEKNQKKENVSEERNQKKENVSEEKNQKKENVLEGKNLKKEKASEEEKKNCKRITYTDRLILLRMTGKEDEKKFESFIENEAESKYEGKVMFSEKSEPPGRILHFQHKPKSQISIPLKDGVKDTEHVIKTKSTRSTELRDLVTQAIREHKIFCIFDNHSYIVRPVREELLSRGWLEVIPDRRLIPRRRPPPMGPTTDREKLNFDRNCNTLEAILTAKETFVDEIRESVSKSASFKTILEGLNTSASPGIILTKKTSQDSLKETLSLFRIIPPTSEKKKNNAEIREFVNKYGALLEKDSGKFREKKIKEREKYYKNTKKEVSRTPQLIVDLKCQRNKEDKKEVNQHSPMMPSSDSFQTAVDVVRDNKRTILQVSSEVKNLSEKDENKLAVGVLYDSSVKDAAAKTDEKESQQKVKKQETSASEAAHKVLFTDSESKTISKMIQSMNARIHFMWLSIKPGIHLKCFNYSPEIINKFQKTTFCTKIGLWSHLNNIQWYAHEVHFPAKSPRMYNTGEADDLQAFFQDFQLTACIGMLKWLSETFFDRGMKAVQTKKGKVPLKAFEFAIKQCEKYVKFKDNEDLSILEEQKILQDDWNNFLQWFYIITNDHGKVQESSSGQLMVVYTKAVETLKLMKRYWPEMDIDGRLNIWIMKPYCASCGRGIFMTNNVYYIGQHSKYIVQKYIEKPLLIYNTKFDIRQWFMITKLTPLEIWMYKECYLRFCTQPFALRNLHESVHLSNNSVQRKYISLRDSGLPDQNMWDSKTFQLYLRTIGHPNAWDDIIYPGMKDAIISTMLAAQDTFDGPRKNWFEVYGADFMISANVKDGPWLIEINENPAMDPSTKVTARLCPQMLRDVIKVVVDKRANKNASTGQWELVYRQNYSPSFGSVDLDVRGKKIARVPYNTKPGVNTMSTPSTPNCRSQEKELLLDCDPGRLYEIVKSLGEMSNSRGDVYDGRDSSEKLIKSWKLMEKNSALLPLTAKNNLKSSLQSLMIMMENRSHIRDKNEENMAHKIIAKTAELTKKHPLDSKISMKKNDKNLALVVSTGRLKRIRNNFLTAEPSFGLNLGMYAMERKGNPFASDSLFPGREKKSDGAQKFLSNDKYKYSKF